MKKRDLVAALHRLMPNQEAFLNNASLPTAATNVAVHLFITLAPDNQDAELLRTFIKALHEVGWYEFDKEDS